jgi:arylsulfatase A-like enzyme
MPRWALRCELTQVSYADFKLGQVLAALEASGRANDTIVVFHSDHG